jgi:hypothetical protein
MQLCAGAGGALSLMNAPPKMPQSLSDKQGPLQRENTWHGSSNQRANTPLQRASIHELNVAKRTIGLKEGAIVGGKSEEEKLRPFAPEEGGIATSSLLPIGNNPKKIAAQLRKAKAAQKGGGLWHKKSLRNMKKSVTMQRFLKKKNELKDKMKTSLSSVLDDMPEGNAPPDALVASPVSAKLMSRSTSRKDLTSHLKKKFDMKKSHSLSTLKQRKEQHATGQCPFLTELRTWYDTRWQLDADQVVADEAMFTDKAILQRESIRLQRPIQQVLKKLYMVIDEDNSGSITHDEYQVLSAKLYCAIRAFWDKELPELDAREMMEVSASDWEQDRQGYNHLNEQRFTLSMFQLCDVWTDFIDGETYLDFLLQLLHILTKVNSSGERVFCSEQEIKSNSEKEQRLVSLSYINVWGDISGIEDVETDGWVMSVDLSMAVGEATQATGKEVMAEFDTEHDKSTVSKRELIEFSQARLDAYGITAKSRLTDKKQAKLMYAMKQSPKKRMKLAERQVRGLLVLRLCYSFG